VRRGRSRSGSSGTATARSCSTAGPTSRSSATSAANPNVSLNLDSDRVDADIVICWGQIRVSDDPPSNEVPDYLEKYRERIAALGWTPESFAGDFSVPLRIELSRIHGW
jgi:PPOX class probable F420-dependent enzyme